MRIRRIVAGVLDNRRSNKKTPPSPEAALLELIQKEPFNEITMEISESYIDNNLVDSLLQKLPVVKLVYFFVKGGLTIRDYLFSRKVFKFLKDLNSIPAHDRQEFIARLSSAEQERFSSTVIMILDRMTDIEKSEILALIVKACITGYVNKDEMMELLHIIDVAYLNDIKRFASLYSLNEHGDHITLDEIGDNATASRLLSAGLLYNLMGRTSRASGRDRSTLYGVTDSGLVLVEIIQGANKEI